MIKPAIQKILDKARERKQQKLAAAAANPKAAAPQASAAGEAANASASPTSAGAGKSAQQQRQFRREVRVGLGVLTVLLGTFGFVAWQRFASGDEAQVVAKGPQPPRAPQSAPHDEHDHHGHAHDNDQPAADTDHSPRLPKLPSRDDRVQPAAWAQAFDQPGRPAAAADSPATSPATDRYRMDDSADVPQTSTVTIRTQVTPVSETSETPEGSGPPRSFAADADAPFPAYGNPREDTPRYTSSESAGNRFTATVTDPDAEPAAGAGFSSSTSMDAPSNANRLTDEPAARYSFTTPVAGADPSEAADQPASGQLPRYSSPSPYGMPSDQASADRPEEVAQEPSTPPARFAFPATTVVADAPQDEPQVPTPATDASPLRP